MFIGLLSVIWFSHMNVLRDGIRFISLKFPFLLIFSTFSQNGIMNSIRIMKLQNKILRVFHQGFHWNSIVSFSAVFSMIGCAFERNFFIRIDWNKFVKVFTMKCSIVFVFHTSQISIFSIFFKIIFSSLDFYLISRTIQCDVAIKNQLEHSHTQQIPIILPLRLHNIAHVFYSVYDMLQYQYIHEPVHGLYIYWLREREGEREIHKSELFSID